MMGKQKEKGWDGMGWDLHIPARTNCLCPEEPPQVLSWTRVWDGNPDPRFPKPEPDPGAQELSWDG